MRKELAKTVIAPAAAPVGVKISCRKLNSRHEFKCQVSDLYDCLTNKQVPGIKQPACVCVHVTRLTGS